MTRVPALRLEPRKLAVAIAGFCAFLNLYSPQALLPALAREFGVGAAEFHYRAATRADLWPQTMTTLSTHDTKRGEDVRARIGVLSQVASLWAEFVARWETAFPAPDPATGLFL